MYRQTAVLSLAVLLVVVAPGRADKLVLKDGRTLSGDVTVDKDEDGSRVYRIVLSDGETRVFPQADVEKYKRESGVTDQDLRTMFHDLEGLVLPVLRQKEPDQREFLRTWEEYRRTLSSEVVVNLRWGLWETPADSDKFLDEWVRYTANFTKIARNAKYKKHRSAAKGSNSLREYTMYPPEGREEVGDALRLALDSLGDCIKLADATTGPLKSLPRKQIEHNAKIRRQADHAAALRDRISTSKNGRTARRNADDAADVLRYRLTKMKNEMQKLTQRADAKINEFAEARTVTLGQFATAKDLMEALTPSRPVRVTDRRTRPPEHLSGAECSLSALPAAGTRSYLAIMDFDADTFGPGVGRVLADFSRSVVAGSGQFTLIDRENMINVLGERDFVTALRCETTQCFASYGKKIRAQKLCHGRASQVGRSLVFTLTIMDVESGRVEAFKTERIMGDINDLMDNIERISCEVLRDSLSSG